MEWTYGAPILQVPSASGISPLALENSIQLRLFLHDGYRWGWNYPLEKLDSPVLDLMNVRYVLTRAADVRAIGRASEVPPYCQPARHGAFRKHVRSAAVLLRAPGASQWPRSPRRTS